VGPDRRAGKGGWIGGREKGVGSEGGKRGVDVLAVVPGRPGLVPPRRSRAPAATVARSPGLL
jgi:hypothetical protein